MCPPFLFTALIAFNLWLRADTPIRPCGREASQKMIEEATQDNERKKLPPPRSSPERLHSQARASSA